MKLLYQPPFLLPSSLFFFATLSSRLVSSRGLLLSSPLPSGIESKIENRFARFRLVCVTVFSANGKARKQASKRFSLSLLLSESKSVSVRLSRVTRFSKKKKFIKPNPHTIA
ncbi:hypothetical protein F5X96DRAFT_622864 [Biscogniauxia mediterranea]|nr:hypothetical protein F5X96DRAFT_622864 [Biscogniauxia mediterranea]